MPTAKRRCPRVSPTVFVLAFGSALAIDALTSAMAQNALERMWTDLVARPSGPESFRFYLQPIMATIAALKDGISDARTGRSP